MDEDVIPPNPVCSAPAPPLLSFPSITLSSANDGQSGHRRSGRIQEIRAKTPKKQDCSDHQMAWKPSRQNPSPTKRHLERVIMMRVPQSKLPGAERTDVLEKQNKNGLEISFAAEHQNEQKDPNSLQSKPHLSPGENVVESFEENKIQNLDEATLDMETSSDLSDVDVMESTSASTGWVIGPLFQSLKSKMASFTDIVMSPVKLFRASSPPPSIDRLNPVSDSDAEPSEEDNVFHSEGLIENKNWDSKTNQQGLGDCRETQSAETFDHSDLKKLQLDEFSSRNSGQTAEPAINKKDSVHLLQSPLSCVVSESFDSSILLKSLAKVSASQETDLKLSSAEREQEDQLPTCLTPLSRPATRNRSESTNINSEDKSQPSQSVSRDMNNSQSSSVCYLQPQCLQLDGADENCQNNLIYKTNKTLPKPFLDTQQSQLDSKMCSVSDVVRPKRGLKLSCHSQDSAKRKKVTDNTKNPQRLHVASHNDIIKGLRTSKRGATLMNTMTHEEEAIKLDNKRPTMLIKAKRKGKSEEAVIIPQIESSSEAMLICSLEKNSCEPHDKPKGSRAKPSGSSTRLKTRKTLIKLDINNDTSMDLETTVPITSTERAEEKTLSKVLVRPDIKQLQSAGKCSDTNKKPLKRKMTRGVSCITESALVSTPSLEPMTPDFSTFQGAQRADSSAAALSQPSKRSRNGLTGAVKSSGFSQTQEAKQHIGKFNSKTKENQNGKEDPAYFEKTLFESNPQHVQSHPQLNLNCCVQLNKAMHVTSVTDKIFLPDSEIRTCTRSTIRDTVIRRRRPDNHKRRCRVLPSQNHKCEEGSKSITMEDADLAASHTSETNFAMRLLRSYSCPEIPSLQPHDSTWTCLNSSHRSRTQASHHLSHSVSHKSLMRARRHTVCSVEVEREIAPLCLRKEVYPSRRSVPAALHMSPSHTHSPSTSLSPLASCFLSSPLAFLSKKSDCRGAAASLSSRIPSPSSSSVMSPSSSSTWHPLAFMSTTDSASALDSCSSENPLRCEAERRQQSEEEDYGEDTSSSSQEFEDVGLREEKVVSDFEAKVGKKHEERGKVSSIKIRKTLPKPQTNLTPMGLPKPIRLKKKEFSLEEIYTNKNFSNPPESRLETIFEVPLSRKNGSESWCGPRRVKRFLEFLEAGTIRKAKKPLVGAIKASLSSSSRTRRGGFPKDEPSLCVQDVDSLLCAKLDELSLWLIHDQRDA